MVVPDWAEEAAKDIIKPFADLFKNDEDMRLGINAIRQIIADHCPFKRDVAYMEVKEPPLLQCIDCRNTESCAGAMARHFNHGRCLHCGGYFKVIRA